MSATPHLGLPTIAAAQAQKHVTHNEALIELDTVVQLAVLDRTLSAPPAAPADGDRYIVAAGASGAWLGQTTKIAAYRDGGWSFLAPKPGWRAWLINDATLIVWTGSAWSEIGDSTPGSISTFGVNATADATNRLAVKSDAVLISHDDVTPGSGDVRIAINKAVATRTASVLFQNGYAGRAEFGLTGDDNWHVKVSADGATWKEALVVDRASGVVSMPYSPSASTPNVLVNGDFQINQRVFAGGALAAGVYGFDRWKAATGGANVSVSGLTVTLASGELEQVIEPVMWGVVSFASQQVTASVDTPSSALTVTLGSQSGTIAAGLGRRAVTLTLGTGDSGNLSFKIKRQTAGSVTFSRVKLEVGPTATAWAARPDVVERLICRRYWQKSYVRANAAGAVTDLGSNFCRSYDSFRSVQVVVNTFLPPMRASPAVTLYALNGEAGKASPADGSSVPTTASVPVTCVATGISANGYTGISAGYSHNSFKFHHIADAEL